MSGMTSLTTPWTGNKIDVEVAKENEFLALLLQDLTKGPNTVNLVRVRNDMLLQRGLLFDISDAGDGPPMFKRSLERNLAMLPSDSAVPHHASPIPGLDVARNAIDAGLAFDEAIKFVGNRTMGNDDKENQALSLGKRAREEQVQPRKKRKSEVERLRIGMNV
jgi:hypothetical protein